MQNPFTYSQQNHLTATAALWNTVTANPRNTARIAAQTDAWCLSPILRGTLKSQEPQTSLHLIQLAAGFPFIFILSCSNKFQVISLTLAKNQRLDSLLTHVPPAPEV